MYSLFVSCHLIFLVYHISFLKVGTERAVARKAEIYDVSMVQALCHWDISKSSLNAQLS